MLGPHSFARDWGVWGWIWALGWFGFVLGVLLVPDALRGNGPLLVLVLPVIGAFLMLTSSRRALGRRA
jgi:hypothetical protein